MQKRTQNNKNNQKQQKLIKTNYNKTQPYKTIPKKIKKWKKPSLENDGTLKTLQNNRQRVFYHRFF